MTLDMGNTDKLSEFRAEAERLGIKVEPPSVNRSGVAFEVEGNTIYYALAALKGVGRQAVEAIVDGARRQAVRRSRPISPAASIRARSTSACWKASPPPAPSTRSSRTARGRTPPSTRCWRPRSARHEAVSVGQNEMFGGPSSRETIAMPAVEPWLPAERLQREYDAIGFFLSGHPLDEYAPLLQKLQVQSWTEFSRSVKAGASAGRVAATVVSRTERRTKTGNKMGIIGLSDPSGHYEAIVFAEGLAAISAICSSRARRCCCSSRAEAQGDEVRARIQSAEPLDQAAAKLQKGLRVFLRDQAPIEPRRQAARRQGRRRGQHGAAARRRRRGRGQAARPLQGLAADRRRHQGGAGRARRPARSRPSPLRVRNCAAAPTVDPVAAGLL